MADDSHLDLKYFIDNEIYNCPYCNRRHVSYSITGHTKFDWRNDKECWVYFVACHSCANRSMHLSYSKIDYDGWVRDGKGGGREGAKFDKDIDIDSQIFYSVPTSFFVLDDRIPAVIRELITESEGCRKMNFLTGASACARKAIYELLVREKAEGEYYADKIKSLEQRFASVDPELFEVLSHIQGMTSDKVHEQSWPRWNAQNLTLITETLKAILHEIYVVPEERKDRSSKIQKLLGQVRSKGGPDVVPKTPKIPEGT